MTENYLVIDQGGHSSRAIVFNSEGRELVSSSVSVATSYPQSSFVEQDSEQVMISIGSCLQEITRKLSKTERQELQSAALIVQRSSFLACSKSDLQPLTNIISWQDTRNQLFVDELSPEYAHIRKKTGLRANAHYGASKMRWLLDNNKSVQAAADVDDLLFVPLAAYIAYKLVGVDAPGLYPVVDPVIASRTLLCALGEMQWDDELLDLFGINRSFMPDIVASDCVIGEIKMEESNIPLQLVGGDQSFISFASGINIQSSDVYVNVGTGAFIQTLFDGESSRVDDNLLCSSAVITHREKILMAEGTVNSASSALDWLWKKEGASMTFDDINSALNVIEYPPLFINTLSGTGSPYWLACKEPRFLFLENKVYEKSALENKVYKKSDDETLSEKTVAVLESIVFSLMDNFVLLKKNKPELARIVISGGLSNYDSFCQKLANLTGVEIQRPLHHEASARGAAMYLMQKRLKADHLQSACFLPKKDTGLYQRYQKYQHIIAGH